MTNEELLSVAEIVERATNRLHKQAADHETKMAEHRAAFGARTEADRKIIAGLREESAKCQAELDDLYQREGIEKKRRMDVEDERDALRAEVAALQERLRSSIARGDFAQMEVAALKSQTPKHPVKVGEWVRRLVPSPACDVGTVAKVVHVDDDTSEIEYDVKRIDGQHGVWFAKNCEPCDPPEATHAEPDLTQLHAKGKEAWSDVPNATQWVEEMRGNSEATHDTEAGKAAAESVIRRDARNAEIVVGDVVRATFWKPGQMSTVTQILPDGRLILEVSSEPWRVDEVVKLTRKCVGADEAWTDVLKVTTCEPVAEEIKVGDVVEVVSNTGLNTWLADVGSVGTVTSIETLEDSLSVRLKDVPDKKNVCGGYVSICDVRKVTT